MPITHSYVSTAPPVAGKVDSAAWNDDHVGLQDELDLKANLASPTFSGTVGGVTKAMVGLGSAENTSDAGKPVSSAQQTALDLKANNTDFASGTYTPSITAEANLDATTTITEAQYIRVGSVVTVSGRFTANATLTATATSFEISLPIASNIGAVEDVAGTAFCSAIAAMGAGVSGSVANNTAVVSWVSSDITSQSWAYSFTFQVL